MPSTKLHKSFKILKRFTPHFLSDFIRKFATATLTPIKFSIDSGHFKSSFRKKSVDKYGMPIPWYTYPCIDFLSQRNFIHSEVLEFGAGNSSFWWAKAARTVTALEGDAVWLKYLEQNSLANLNMRLVSIVDAISCANDVENTLKEINKQYDVIIIDGLYRPEMIQFALTYRKKNGIIICDNADGYGFYDGLKDSGLKRIDFYGYAPGVILPHCTSLFFDETEFLSASIPIKSLENVK